MSQHRRTLLASIGGITVGSIAMTQLSSQPAQAAVSFGTLDVADRTYEQGSKIQDVRISVNGNYKFDSEEVPDRWELILKVGTDGNYTKIGEQRMAPTTTADSGTKEVRGSIFDTPHFAIDNFQLSDGESETQIPINVKLIYNVVANEQTVATADVQTTTTLTVTPGKIEATAEIKGTGEIQISK